MMRQIIIVMLVSMLTACASQQKMGQEESERDETLFPFDRILATDTPYIAMESEQNKVDESDVVENKERTAKFYPGTGEHLRMPKARAAIHLEGDAVELNFEKTPLIEIVHAVMGDILELNYVIQSAIGGEVTLRTRTPVQRDDLFSILESLLQANGASMVRDAQDRFIISAAGIASKLAPRISSPYEKGAGYTTTVIPLEYIGVAEMVEILMPMTEPASFVRIDAVRNLLVMAGSRGQMEGWLGIVATFDIDLLKGMSVGIFPVENISVGEMEAALNSVLGEAGAAGAKGLLGIVRLFPIEQLNSMMVVTPQAHYLAQIQQWMTRLDLAPDTNFEKHLFVYSVQNGTATHIAELLSSVFSGSSSTTGSSSKPKGSGVAPGLTPEVVSAEGVQAVAGSTSSINQTSAGPTSSSYTLDDIGIVADEENNAMLIYATHKDFRKIKGALKKLDILPAQVVIEASILEVALSDDLEYGLEWTLRNGLGRGYNGDLSLGVPAVNTSGLSYAIKNAAGNLTAVLNLLQEESLLNVISTPSVMVLDNHTAEIHVGTQQPIQTTQTVSTGAVITNGVEFKDTGVRLTVTPSVNAGGVVTMDIAQSVTDVGEADTATGQRSFLERSITSRVAVRSGESVVLGGLIRENKTDSESGIPVLHQLPVIGNLFGKTSLSSTRTELLVIITPHVLFNEQDLRDISREMRSKVRNLELFQERDDYRWRGAEPARVY